MRLEISHKPFGNGTNRTHFLLREAALKVTASLEDGASVEVPAISHKGPNLAYVLDLNPALLPKRMTLLQLDFSLAVTVDGASFRTLEISQRFAALPLPAGVAAASYILVPSGWRDPQGGLCIGNKATHPLLDLADLGAGKIRLVSVVVDLTDAWRHLHRDNGNYRLYEATKPEDVAFRILGHLGGQPFIWYAAVPRHLADAGEVSAHIFLAPADNSEKQNKADAPYLTNNKKHFENDGGTLFNYLSAPIEDADIVPLEQKFPFLAGLRRRRNVVSVARAFKGGKASGRISPMHWDIPCGFQRAFTASSRSGEGAPRQLLLIPQRSGDPESARADWFGAAVTTDLKPVTDAIIALLRSGTSLLGGPADPIPVPGKMVLSCYSETGNIIWAAALANRDWVKALIAVEPQGVNQKGSQEAPGALAKDAIPALLEKNVQIFVIGRHHWTKYRPDIADLTKIRLVPDDPQAVFRFPPDPTVNEFIRYRVERLLDPTLDPWMHEAEQAIFQKLAARGISGPAAFAHIFQDDVNADPDRPHPLGVSQWYSHNFAVNGGEMLTPASLGLYQGPAEYRTFFQAAVREIG